MKAVGKGCDRDGIKGRWYDVEFRGGVGVLMMISRKLLLYLDARKEYNQYRNEEKSPHYLVFNECLPSFENKATILQQQLYGSFLSLQIKVVK